MTKGNWLFYGWRVLPLQVIYKGTTMRCLLYLTNCLMIGMSASRQTTGPMKIHHALSYISIIVVPFFECKREELGLSSSYPALALFDHFKGQTTEKVFKLLEKHS
jgi:hypothetical protein